MILERSVFVIIKIISNDIKILLKLSNKKDNINKRKLEIRRNSILQKFTKKQGELIE